MSSLTTVLQFCFVVFHCTFIYGFFKIIAMIDGVLLRIAGRPMGHLFFGAADCFMLLLIDAAAYPISKRQNFSTPLFLPAFITVQWVRISSSATLFLLAGRTISSEDVKGVLESVREMLQDVFIRGRQHREHHRRPSFTMRMLNMRPKHDSEPNNEMNHEADKEIDETPIYSDSNTQTNIHLSHNTAINSATSMQNGKIKRDNEEPNEAPPDNNTPSIIHISEKDLEENSNSSKCGLNTDTEGSPIDEENLEGNSNGNQQKGNDCTEEQKIEDVGDHSSLKTPEEEQGGPAERENLEEAEHSDIENNHEDQSHCYEQY